MPLQPLPFVDRIDAHASGDVAIHPSAAIAPGVILRAAPDSRIVIASGVCIGMGTVINACGGEIAIEAGANLGAGVLIVGAGTVGANACIGGVTTIFNTSVAPMEIIPAGTILGDTSRQREAIEEAEPEPEPEQDRATEPEKVTSETTPPETAPPEPEATNNSKHPPGNPVYGQVRVNQLLYTLFPKGNSPNHPPGSEQ